MIGHIIQIFFPFFDDIQACHVVSLCTIYGTTYLA
jgi:hypothetical protein